MQAIYTILQNGSNEIRPIDGPSERLSIVTAQRMEFRDLTARVEAEVAASGIVSGTVTVRSLHTTAAVFLGEWQDALLADYRRLLELLVPDGEGWKHNDPRHSDCDRQNAAAHLRALLLGSSVSLPVRRGGIERGTWQSIVFVELDGPRDRSVSIEIRPER